GGSNITIRYNVFHDWTGTGFKSAGCATCNAYYNIVYHNGYMGAQLYGGSSNVNIFNNVFYNNGQGPYGYGGFHLVNQGGLSTNVVLKNNIFLNNTNVNVAGEQVTIDLAPAGFAEDYNLLYSSTGTNLAQYNGVDYTWSAWKTAGFDTHGVNANPNFSNVATGYFTLLSTSPAINVGANLGATYQYGLSPSSVWPSAVSTFNQNSYGSGWDMGAFVF